MPFLIDDKYLTDNTNIATSTKDKSLRVAMQTVTVINLKPLLGLPLYELYEQHLAGQATLSAKQAELLVSIQYYMALRVEREMMYNLLNVNNKGVTQDEHAANMAVVNAKRQDVEAKAEFVKSSILNYLAVYKADFPQFYPEPACPAIQVTDYAVGLVFAPQPTHYFM